MQLPLNADTQQMPTFYERVVSLTIDHVVDEKMKHSLKHLECVACYELAWPPAIYCGENGHMNVCRKCRPRIEKCPMRCSTKWLQKPIPCMAWSDEPVLCRCQCSAACPWTCPIRDYVSRFPKHLEDCKYSIRCTCTLVFASLHQFQQHIFNCPNEIVSCPFCQQKLSRSQVQSDTHIRICPGVLTKCPVLGCSQKMKRCDLDAHQQNECQFRLTSPPITCESCRNKLRVSEEKSHLEKCPHRVITCPQCHTEMLSKFDVDHAVVCPCRTILCRACVLPIPLREINDHVTKDCPKRKVVCNSKRLISFIVGAGVGLTSMVFGGVYKNVLSLNGSVSHHNTWPVLSGVILVPLTCVNNYDRLQFGAAGLYLGVTAAAATSIALSNPNTNTGLFCTLCPLFNMLCTIFALTTCGITMLRSQY